MAEPGNSKTTKAATQATAAGGKKPSERWLLTRKTWRYMSDAKCTRVTSKVRQGASNPNELAVLQQQFQEVCTQSQEFLLWEPTRFPSGYKQQVKMTVALANSSSQAQRSSTTSANVSDPSTGRHQRSSFVDGSERGYPHPTSASSANRDRLKTQTADSTCMTSSTSYFYPPASHQSVSNPSVPTCTSAGRSVHVPSTSSSAFVTSTGARPAPVPGPSNFSYSSDPASVGVPSRSSVFVSQADHMQFSPSAPSASDYGPLAQHGAQTSGPLPPEPAERSQGVRRRRRRNLDMGTQTEESCFFDLEIRRVSSAGPNSPTHVTDSAPMAASANNSQEERAAQNSFSSAVMKYFGMGRKKTEKDKKDRFKTINYDRNLRNIKSKNVDVDSLVDSKDRRFSISGSGHESEATDGFTPDSDSCIAIQVGESLVYAWLNSLPKQSNQSVNQSNTQVKMAPDKPVRPRDWTGTKPRTSQTSTPFTASPTQASLPAGSTFAVPAPAAPVPCGDPVPSVRRRKTTMLNSQCPMPPPPSIVDRQEHISTIQSTTPTTSTTEDSGRWTSHTSPRYSIANSEDLPLRDTSVSSGTGDDNELAQIFNAYSNESEMLDDMAFDLDSDLEFRRGSMDTSIDTVDDAPIDFGPRHIFFGEQFNPFKSSCKTEAAEAVSPPYHSGERPSLPIFHSQLPVKGQGRSSSTSGPPPPNSDNASDDNTKVRATNRRKVSPLSSAAHHVASGLHLNSLLSAVMLKSKSGSSLAASAPGSANPAQCSAGFKESAGSHASRIMTKKIWKTRSKSQSRATASSTCIWTPQGSCKWTSITGRQVALTDTTLLHLTEIERITLQKVALAKLQALNLGVTLRPPAEAAPSGHKPKRRAHLLRKRGLSGGGFFDGAKKDAKDRPAGSGLVFGIPIDQCIANEREARLRAAAAATNGAASSDQHLDLLAMNRKTSHGSRTSFGSLIEGLKPDKGGSCESLNNGDRKRSSSLSCSSDFLTEETSATCPRVPTLVSVCFSHLEAYGLNTLGIFRVSSSKKRVRQLREDFDGGKEIIISEDCCPHDVATLIKEFFRDLPEPLLTRELYAGFVQTQRVRNRRLQMEALQHLIQMLPTANRDTLHGLLHFLANVASKSADHRAPNGEMELGNKMDSNNLATLFAPNILHTVKPGTSAEKIAAESVARAEERIDVINVIRSMIDHYKEIFEVSAELLDEVYVHLMDTHPEALDRLLRRRCQNDEAHEDLDTSSSVFEGSECSSVPRTPTYDDLQHFTSNSSENTPSSCSTIRKWSHGSESAISNPIDISPTPSSQPNPTRYRKREDILHENGGTGGRYASASRERRKEERQQSETRHRITEASRSRTDPALANASIIKRRADSVESPSRIASSEVPTRAPPQLMMSRPVLNRERSEPTIERRIVVQPTVVHASRGLQPLRSASDHSLTEGEHLERRLSTPTVKTSSAVITASLRISVAGGSTCAADKMKGSSNLVGKSFTVENDHDIPFIEDNSSSQDDSSLTKSSASDKTTRQRSSVTSLKGSQVQETKAGGDPSRCQWSGSSDSYLGQPLTGSMQVTPIKSSGQVDKQGREPASIKSASHDSVLSAASFLSSPPATPLSPTSSSSNTSLPPTSPLSYGYHSPPQSPALESRLLDKKDKELVQRRSSGDPSQLETVHDKPVPAGVMRSKTVDIERMMGVGRSHHVTPASKEEWLKKERLRNAEHSTTAATVASAIDDDSALKKKSKKKYVGSRNQTDYLPSAMARQAAAASSDSRSRMTSVLRKRWEIIASNPDGPETLV